MTDALHTAETPEFHRPFDLNLIGTSWREVTIDANEAERAALARRFGILSLSLLRAVVRMRRARGGDYICVEGRMTAAAEQECVVTLAPVAEAIDEPLDLLFGPLSGEEPELDAEGGFSFDLEAAEPVAADGVLDLGELVAQTFSLALDPYPHAVAPGVADHFDPEEEAEPAVVSPFAVLAGLKGKRES